LWGGVKTKRILKNLKRNDNMSSSYNVTKLPAQGSV
jgi:hypothetical protein